MLIQVPAVQTYITGKVTDSFEKQWGTRVEVERVNLTFFETALIEGIYIEDQAGDTLIYAGSLKADIGLFALFDQTLVLDEIALENAYINLYRHQDSTRFNYEFIAESFASEDTTQVDTASGGGFDFDLQQLRLEQVRFDFIDDSSQTELRVQAPYFLTELETLGLQEEHVRIDNISLRELDVLFSQPATSPSDTARIAADTLQDDTPNQLDSAWLNPSGFRVTVDNFEMEDSRIRYKALDKSQEGKLNFENMDVASLNLDLNDFYLGSDTLRLELANMAFLEQNSLFRLNGLAFELDVERSLVTARLQELITANSRLTDEILIENLDITATDDMLAGLRVSTSIEEAVLSMEDAAYFTDALDTLPNLQEQDLLLTLDFELKDKQATAERLEIRAGDGLYLNARADAGPIDAPEQMHFDIQLRELTTSMAYLEALSLLDSLPPGSAQAGNITLMAQAQGSMSDAELTARINSGVGSLQTNVIYKSPTQNSYLIAGNIDASNFDLRPFAGDSSGLGTLNLKSRIRARGRGEQIDVEKFSLLVQSLEFNDYTYEGLAVEGFFVDSTFELATAYADEFLDINLMVKSDLKDSLPLIVADGRFNRANLMRLNLSEDSLIVGTHLHAEVRGQTPDNIRGVLEMRDTELVRGADSWVMDSLIVTSHQQDNGRREIALESDFMSASLTGNYTFEELPAAIDQFINYYSSAYPVDTTEVEHNQNIELDFILRSEPVIVRAFVPNFELTYPMTINASLDDGSQDFSLDVSAPGIVYDSIVIRNLTIEANTQNRVLSYDINSDRIRASEDLDIPDFRLNGQWAEDSLHFDLGLAPPTDSTHLQLGGAVTFSQDSISLELQDTDVSLYGREFMLAEDATINYAPDYLSIDNFTLQRDDQRISIYTRDADTPEPKLFTEFRNFEIAEFMSLAGMEEYGLQATLHGDITLTDVVNLSEIEADLSINNLIVDSIRAGDIAINVNKVSDNGRLNTDISLQGPGNDLHINGFYNMEDSTNAVSLDIDLNSLRLATWEPFVQEFLTDLSGSLQGQMQVNGTAAQPAVEGFVRFRENTAFRLAATGVRYQLQDQQITMSNEEVQFNKLTLIDEQRQELVVTGGIEHNNFEDINLDMRVSSRDFQLVDKPRTLQEPFFGTLFVRTDLGITGPLDDVQVNGTIRINEKTDISLVLLEEDQTVGKTDYINYVDRNAFLERDTASAVTADSLSLQQAIDISGFTLDANLVITPESRFTVIIDPATGDNLQVSGEADLRLRMSPLEEMNLQGVFTVASGRYRLSFLEVIQKNFDLQQGSTVEFDGDPLNAQLDMTAIYTTEASRYPLIEMQSEFLSTAELSAAKQRKPVEVHLSMLGTLEDPAFSFNIVVPEADFGTNSAVAQQLREIRQDETKLFKQVFGLIVLNRFIPETPGLGSGGGGAEQAINARVDQSLSQFLTDQLNQVTQDYLGVSIEVNVDTRQNLEGQDAGYTEKDVGLELGRSFFNERVEVKVGGTTSVGESGGTAVGTGGTGSGTQFAGSFEILYHINERGNLNLKIFQRNERNLLTNEFVPQPGVSLSYTKSFNRLSGFINREEDRREILKSDGAIEVDEE